MESDYPSQTVTHIKFLSTSDVPRMRRINFFIEEPVYEDLRAISQHEAMDFSSTTRELLAIGLRYYKFKRGTLNSALAQNNKTFYCQVCGQLTKLRNMHTMVVMNDAYSFCEPCFFADKYKGFVISMINRSYLWKRKQSHSSSCTSM